MIAVPHWVRTPITGPMVDPGDLPDPKEMHEQRKAANAKIRGSRRATAQRLKEAGSE